MGNVVEFKKREAEQEINLLCVNCFRIVELPPEWAEATDLKELACPLCSEHHIEPATKQTAEAASALRELYEDQQAWVNEAARMLKEVNDRDTVLHDFIKQTARLASQMINDPVIVDRIGLKALGNYHHMVNQVVNLIKSQTGIIDIKADGAGVTADGGEVK